MHKLFTTKFSLTHKKLFRNKFKPNFSWLIQNNNLDFSRPLPIKWKKSRPKSRSLSLHFHKVLAICILLRPDWHCKFAILSLFYLYSCITLYTFWQYVITVYYGRRTILLATIFYCLLIYQTRNSSEDSPLHWTVPCNEISSAWFQYQCGDLIYFFTTEQ